MSFYVFFVLYVSKYSFIYFEFDYLDVGFFHVKILIYICLIKFADIFLIPKSELEIIKESLPSGFKPTGENSLEIQ